MNTYTMKKITLPIALVLIITISSMAQTVIWVGVSDSDFFNEANWIIEGTQNAPAVGSIDPNTVIDLDLVVNTKQFAFPANTSLSFNVGKGLTLNKASVDLGTLQAGYIKLVNGATVILRSTAPLGNEATLRLEDNYSWIKFLNVGAAEVASTYLAKITTQENAVTLDVNILINQYYFNGSLLRLKDASVTALTLFDGAGQTGESFSIVPHQIYSRTQLGAFENKASSFRLERGYQAVMAIYQNGTGKSETFIASEEPLQIDLPAALNNTISFVRVMPWNWVTKKGANKFKEIGNTWTYNWNNNSASLPEMEYAPMAWGTAGASLTAVQNYIQMEKVTHVLGFNESDNCNGQSGQFNNLCQISVAVPLFQNLMRTGLRLVSPSPREEGPFGWLKDFRNLAVQTDVRYDVLGVHWYDWGGNPVNTPFENATTIFNRFKNYIDRVYAEHKMPIWITEFNANPNRDASVHLAFLQLALPYLESLEYVERYDFFEPMPENAGNRNDIAYAVFFDGNGNITPLGEFYRDFQSTPSIPQATFAGSKLLAGLNSKISLSMVANKTNLAEGESMTITFTTTRPVGAPESFTLQLNIAEDQYILSQTTVTIPEGGATAQVTLTAVDDVVVEELMNATITLTNLSSGIEWDNNAVNFTITSDDVPVITSVEGEASAVQLYPNPTTGLIKVEASANIISLSLIAPDGRVVSGLAMNDNVIDLQGVRPGVYFVKMILGNGEVLNKRVMKY
jgi:hypothetical protein